jgi:hypothetical protein
MSRSALAVAALLTAVAIGKAAVPIILRTKY